MKNEFYIINEITEETLKNFVEFLKTANDKPITIILNSCGGDIFAALGISNLIKNKNVTIEVVGICASAATLICCGGKVRAAANSMFMIHLPLAGLADYYNADELAKVQNSLIEITNSLISTYSQKLKLTADEIQQAMQAETWLSAADALEIGLVDEIGDVEIKNLFNLLEVSKLEDKKLDAILAEKLTESVLVAERGRVAALMAMKNDSPAVNSIINKAIENGKTAEEIKPFIEAINESRAQEKARYEEFFNMVKDNLNSGAENVQGSTPPPTEQEKNAAYAADIAKFTNEILGAR